nr:hypothetical protein [Tanacetum cinerariifolium]
MESIFTTGSSSVTLIPSPKSTMTPSIITTTTTAGQPPIPPTPIPSDVLQTLSIFASVFRFEDRVKSLEVNFSKFMRTDQSTEAVSNISESSLKSSIVTSLLNPIIDPGMESIFTTGSSSVTLIPLPKSTMTPSIITTTTTASQPPIPLTPIPSDVLQTLPNFASVFRFEDRVKSLEVNFSEFMRTDQSTEAVSNISTIDDNMKKIIKEQVKSQVKAQVTRILPRIEEYVNAQLEAQVLTRSSHSSRTSYAVAADLSEMELKKILIDKMEGNKSIQRSDEQRNLYKALFEAYDADKTILDSYGESAILKRRREEDDDQEGPSAGSDRASKRRREGREHASASTPSEPATGSAGRSTTGTQSRQLSANFSNFIMNWLGVYTLTPELLAGPTYELMRGSCNSLTELEYHLEEVYKATTDQLDWDNPEGQQYPYNLLQPLPLISDNRGRRVIPFAHFINNDLEYLRGGTSSRKYTTSVTKTKAADYGHIKWIEDLVSRTMWIQEPLNYDKHALWGVSHWGRKRQQFYGFTVNWESALDVYSKRRIIAVTDLKIVEWHNYKHLDWISRRVEDLQLGVESY